MRTLSRASRNPSLTFQWQLIPISLAVIFVVLQIRNGNSIVKSALGTVKNDTNEIQPLCSARTSASAHLYSLQTDSRVGNITHPIYTWIGNQWVPPMGVPCLLPRQIRHIFRSENTLWLGDSTARQDYQTMYQLINSDNTTRDNLNKNINKGKKGRPPRHCPARRQSEYFFSDLGQVKGTDQNCHSRNATMMSNDADIDKSWSSVDQHIKAGKFDLGIGGQCNSYDGICCYDGMMNVLRNHRELLEREYSVLVISGGVHESVLEHTCKRANESDKGIASHALDLLDFLFQEVSGPSLFVIWKTHGPTKDDRRTARMEQIDQSLVTAARLWFAEEQPPYMDLADFNLEIDERAHGVDRIEGDMRPHWGLEARLLSIEMVSHSVHRKQERESARTPDSKDEWHD